MNTKWASLHIFYHDIRNYDSFIVLLQEVMSKFVKEKRVQKWFFIRYWEGGPHIRLRFKTKQEDIIILQIENYIKLFWAKCPDEIPLTKAIYYKNHHFDGEVISMEQLPWYENRSIHNISYIPELSRYGGENVINYSESIFMLSSELICYLIQTIKPDPAKKMIIGLTITRLLIEELLEFQDVVDNRQFSEFYKAYWQSFVSGKETENLLKLFTANENSITKYYLALKKNVKIKNYIQQMKKELSQVREILEDELYIHRIVASHIHMTNNRFGISPFVEYYICEYLSLLYKENSL